MGRIVNGLIYCQEGKKFMAFDFREDESSFSVPMSQVQYLNAWKYQQFEKESFWLKTLRF